MPSASVRGVYTRNELSAVFPVMVMPGAPAQTLVIQPTDQWDAFLQLDLPIVDLGAWFRAHAAYRGSAGAQENVLTVRLSVEGQVALTEKNYQGIMVQAAIDKLSPELRGLYPYDNLAEFQKKAKFFPMPPLKPDGVHASYDDWNAAYQRFKSA